MVGVKAESRFIWSSDHTATELKWNQLVELKWNLILTFQLTFKPERYGSVLLEWQNVESSRPISSNHSLFIYTHTQKHQHVYLNSRILVTRFAFIELCSASTCALPELLRSGHVVKKITIDIVQLFRPHFKHLHRKIPYHLVRPGYDDDLYSRPG